MTTNQLRLFLALARHCSLARAAAQVELGQAAVSERLKALEAEVGALLFERQERRLPADCLHVQSSPHANCMI